MARVHTRNSKRLDVAHAPIRSLFTPALATLVDAPPQGKEWLHEIKYDGYRILAYILGPQIYLISRNGKDWTSKFPNIVQALTKLKLKSGVLDGEIVVLNEKGQSKFNLLQEALSDERSDGFTYFVFDLLQKNNIDLRAEPLIERKQQLEAILKQLPAKSAVRFSTHSSSTAKVNQLLKSACSMHLEGLISKRIDAAYPTGRSLEWQKSKCLHEDEFVIGGFTDPQGSRQNFGSLLLGYYNKKGEFIYAGRVGTGFNLSGLRKIMQLLKPIELKKCSFHESLPAKDRQGAHYVKPKYLAQIRFTEWTSSGRLRHPAFLGLREDKSPREVIYSPLITA